MKRMFKLCPKCKQEFSGLSQDCPVCGVKGIVQESMHCHHIEILASRKDTMALMKIVRDNHFRLRMLGVTGDWLGIPVYELIRSTQDVEEDA